MNIRDFRRWNDYMTVGVSFLANTLVMFLVLTERNVTLKSYSKMIILSCFMDYVFCCGFLGTVIDAIVQDHVFLTFSDGFFRSFPRSSCYILLAIHIFVVGLATVQLPIEYMFRYQLICKKHEMSVLQLIASVIVCCLIVMISTSLFIFAFTQVDETELSQYEHLFAGDKMWLDEHGNLPRFIAIDCTNQFFLLALFVSGITIIGSYMVTLWFALSIYRGLNSMRSIASKRTLQLQRSMTWILIIKAVVPFLLASLPVLLLLCTVSLGINISHLGLILVIINGYIPVISPMSTLFLISGYRRRIINGFRNSSVAQNINKTYRSSHPSIASKTY